MEEILSLDVKKEDQIFSIASLRVDAVISSSFGVSREKSNELVDAEKVLLNFLPCKNASKRIKEGDLISVRGFGRVRVLELIRRNKKRENTS